MGSSSLTGFSFSWNVNELFYTIFVLSENTTTATTIAVQIVKFVFLSHQCLANLCGS